MRRVEVEAELGPVVEGREGALGRLDVVRDARGVDFQAPLHPALLELVQHRVPAVGEQGEALLVELLVGGREDVPLVPHVRPDEAVDHRHLQLARRRARPSSAAPRTRRSSAPGSFPAPTRRCSESWRSHGQLSRHPVVQRRDGQPVVRQHPLQRRSPRRRGGPSATRGRCRPRAAAPPPRSPSPATWAATFSSGQSPNSAVKIPIFILLLPPIPSAAACRQRR